MAVNDRDVEGGEPADGETRVPVDVPICSVTTVTRDRDRGEYRAAYDRAAEPPSLAVVSTVATALGRNPYALPALYEVVDPEALDGVVGPPGGRASDVRVRFRYAGCEILVTAEAIAVRPDPDRVEAV